MDNSFLDTLVNSNKYTDLSSNQRSELITRYLNKDSMSWVFKNFQRLGINDLEIRKQFVSKLITIDPEKAAEFLRYFRVTDLTEAKLYKDACRSCDINLTLLSINERNKSQIIYNESVARVH